MSKPISSPSGAPSWYCDSTAKALSAATPLGEVHLLVAGEGVDGVAAAAAQIAGVGKVHVADDAAYAHALAENIAPLVVELMGHHDAFIAPATSNGKNILPRVAAALDVDQISEIIAVESADTFKRPIYAGNGIATVQSADAVKVLTVRVTAFDPAKVGAGVTASIAALAPIYTPNATRFVGQEIAASDRPELTAARVIVSGGRGMGSADNFHLLDTLADTTRTTAEEAGIL
jgi:electron transfer flavoprotein alpha subunit